MVNFFEHCNVFIYLFIYFGGIHITYFKLKSVVYPLPNRNQLYIHILIE